MTLPKLSAKLITILVLTAVVLLLIGLLFSQWQKRQSAAAESRLERAQSGATVESAKDAIATQGAAAEREKASDSLTQSNAEEIRNAKGADAVVDPAARDAGLASLCRRSAYRGSERCVRFLAPR